LFYEPQGSSHAKILWPKPNQAHVHNKMFRLLESAFWRHRDSPLSTHLYQTLVTETERIQGIDAGQGLIRDRILNAGVPSLDHSFTERASSVIGQDLEDVYSIINVFVAVARGDHSQFHD
jgi:hypothetical protein